MKKVSNDTKSSRVGRQSPARKDAVETRASLLSAAGELFAKKGFDGVNLREVCAAAGANLGSVRYYFGGKKELYAEVVLLAHQEILAADSIPVFDPSMDAREALRNWLRFFLRLALIRRPAHPFVGRIMFNEFRQPTEVLDTLVKTVIAPVRNRLQAVVAAVKGVPADDAEAAEQTNFIMLLCVQQELGSPLLERFGYPPPRAEKEVLELADRLHAFVLNGIG